MEDFLRACHDVVLENHPKSLGPKMSLTHGSLLQRANHENGDHHLTIEHLFGLLLHTGDIRPLTALANQFGFDLLPRERPAAKPLMTALCHLTAECGDVGRLIFDATADNHISQHEKAQGEKAILEAIDALQILRESLKAA
ncbi:Rha family transcriptional regulator [Pseudomonas gregormendelii]|uniref:Rha family transcriptional regulator n=1 Tax=Pseudomonas gregormendelii TaxID=1628277 RepID=A0ABS3AHB8_9PSED|nr:phage regulatory CII family protein [Pseudomonas gregormendelii]MBN3966287.1 Rha family transcriptional regulator [Pseudomonas gregormendelii]